MRKHLERVSGEWAYSEIALDTERLPSQLRGRNASEDVGNVAGDISAMGEGQVRIPEAAKGDLALG